MVKNSEHKLDKEVVPAKGKGRRSTGSTNGLRPQDKDKPKEADQDVKRRLDSLLYGDLFTYDEKLYTYEGLSGTIAKVVLMAEAEVDKGNGKPETIRHGIERHGFSPDTLINIYGGI